MRRKSSAFAKISSPRLHGMVHRERLFGSIDHALTQGAVWIAGPPGAGKTTLAASYCEVRARPVYWYQCDASDNDPSTFFYFLGLAAPARKAPLPLLQPEYLPNLDGFAARFFRAFFERFEDDALWVLDNFQELPLTSPLNQAIANALTLMPTGRNAVIISRAEPPLQFARPLASKTLSVVRWPDLRLSFEEAELVCKGSSISDPATVRALHQQSDGWAAGLVLMLERARRASLTLPELEIESREAVFDYFAGQVFLAASEQDRRRLLSAAFAPRITTRILIELTDDADAGRLLESLYRRHLFTDRRPLPLTGRVASDGPVFVYQFHALFRSFLRGEAERSLDSASVRDLSNRTARLLEADGLIDDAVQLYVEACEWESAATLILREAPALLRQGRWQTIIEWVQRLPSEFVDDRPWLLFWAGKALIPINQNDARTRLERAYTIFEAASDKTGQLVSICGIVWTHYFEAFATENMDRWIEPLEKLLASTESFESMSIELAGYSAFQLVTMWVKPSHPMLHPSALRLLDLLDADLDATERVSAGAFLVQYFDLIGRFDLGARVIEKVDRITRSTELAPVSLVSWWTNCGYHFYITVHHEEAMSRLDRAVDLARSNGLPQGEFSAQVFRAYAATVEGDVATALQAVEAQEKLLHPSWRVGLTQHHLAWALLEQLRGNPAKAAIHTRLHLDAARQTAAPFFLIVWGTIGAGSLAQAGYHDEALAIVEEVRAVRAGTYYDCYDGLLTLDESYVHFLKGNQEKARMLLRQALGWARQHNMPYFFRWLVGGVSPLIAHALSESIEVEYARDLASTWRLKPPSLDTPGWPWRWRITALGDFTILERDEPLKFGRKAPTRLLQLLKALVAMGMTGVDAQKLMMSVWPEAEGDAAHASFTNALHRLRKLMGDDTVLELHDGKVSLDLDRCWVDVLAFERYCASNEAEMSAAPEQHAVAERLLTLYRGHFLPQDMDFACAAPTRERLRSLFERQIVRIGEQLESAGRHEAAVTLYRRAVEVETLTESFYVRLMRSLLAVGAHSEALQVYRRCRDLLSIVLGVAPSAAARALFEQVKAKARSEEV